MAEATAAEAILLFGPTATGKSEAAVRLVEQLPLEIISVDSAMLYRGMDIGTAKPSAALLQRVPHHLVDILDPIEPYSAARFRTDAQALIAQIRAAGRVPLLVGGTMLYFKALLEGMAELPAADPAIREALVAEAAREGWSALHEQLRSCDPEAAARIHPNDPQRIQRALEVYRITGRPLSALQAEGRQHRQRQRFLTLAILPAERAGLRERIATRLDQMLKQGFIDEVAELKRRGDLNTSLPSIRAVGYRQIWDHLDGIDDLETTREKILHATAQLAKRQHTWMRKLPNDLQVEQASDARLAAYIDTHLGS